jgi:hypothetical protein
MPSQGTHTRVLLERIVSWIITQVSDHITEANRTVKYAIDDARIDPEPILPYLAGRLVDGANTSWHDFWNDATTGHRQQVESRD